VAGYWSHARLDGWDSRRSGRPEWFCPDCDAPKCYLHWHATESGYGCCAAATVRAPHSPWQVMKAELRTLTDGERMPNAKSRGWVPATVQATSCADYVLLCAGKPSGDAHSLGDLRVVPSDGFTGR
jgi:hypothetical protein